MRDDLRRLALFTSGIAEMTRNRAEDFVRAWVGGGELGREQAQGMVRELLEWSRANRDELMRFLRSEMQGQMETLGVARANDIERLEQRIQGLEDAVRNLGAAASSQTKTTAKRKTAARRGAAGRTSPRKTTRKRGPSPGAS